MMDVSSRDFEERRKSHPIGIIRSTTANGRLAGWREWQFPTAGRAQSFLQRGTINSIRACNHDQAAHFLTFHHRECMRISWRDDFSCPLAGKRDNERGRCRSTFFNRR